MPVQSYKELVVWQRAMDLVVEIYKVTRSFPREEMYGLVAQIRRAVVSVASNVAEGQARGKGREFAKFLRIALGSLQEVKTQLIVSERLGYVVKEKTSTMVKLANEVGRLLRALTKSVDLES
jgi:four helix bundle protein